LKESKGPNNHTQAIRRCKATLHDLVKMDVSQYLADSPPSVVPLAIKPHFEALTDEEKLYAHHISRSVDFQICLATPLALFRLQPHVQRFLLKLLPDVGLDYILFDGRELLATLCYCVNCIFVDTSCSEKLAVVWNNDIDRDLF
jgi:hypothetical protein